MAPKLLPSPKPPNPQGPHPAGLGKYNPSPSGNAGPSCFSTGPPPSGHMRNVSSHWPGEKQQSRSSHVGLGASSAQYWDRQGLSGKGRLGHLSVLVGSPSPCSPTGTLGVQPGLCQTLWPAQTGMWDCDFDPCTGNPVVCQGLPHVLQMPQETTPTWSQLPGHSPVQPSPSAARDHRPDRSPHPTQASGSRL